MSQDNSNEKTAQFEHLMGGGVRVNLFHASGGGDSENHAEAMIKASDRVQLRQGGAASYVYATSAAAVEGISEGGQILAARSQQGMPRSGARITDEDLIDLGGVQARIRDAIAVGAVVRNPDGSFSLAGGIEPGK